MLSTKLLTKYEKNLYLEIFLFYRGVADTADKHSFANISANFRKNSKRSYWDTQGPGGKLIHVQNLKLKISCQIPFKLLSSTG
jgi:hypothetical protein